ncbi:MAG: class I SAM-dependent methyltransferase [Candidatus Bathyarchaeia archaeon]|jgi:SAM-dependent methyltransferase
MAKQATAVPDFGNWVSTRLIFIFGILGLALLATAFLFWAAVIPSTIFFAVALYFAYARYLFSSKGGNVQNKIWETVITQLDWNGEGKALDIGCGNGALTIKLAQKFATSQVTGIDYWGERWEYSKSTCEANAKAAGVGDRAVFEKASASRLPFDDGYFDGAVSNLCFHEVADSKDKRGVIREALRVVKKDGKFAFQDLFLLKSMYGDVDDLVATIKSWGVSEVEFVETRNAPFIPAVLKLPFMVGRIGIIRGRK